MRWIYAQGSKPIKWAVRRQPNLKHCAAADTRYFNQLNRAILGKDAILTSFSKSPEILLQSGIKDRNHWQVVAVY